MSVRNHEMRTKIANDPGLGEDSDLAIARRLGCSGTMVGRVRDELGIPPMCRKGSGGLSVRRVAALLRRWR